MEQVIPKEDWQWVRDVYKVVIPADTKVVVLKGSEHCAIRVEVYDRDHYQAIPTAWEPDEEGNMKVVNGPVAFAFDEVDFFGLRAVCDELFDESKPMTPDRRRDLANKMHVHLHAAIHV